MQRRTAFTIGALLLLAAACGQPLRPATGPGGQTAQAWRAGKVTPPVIAREINSPNADERPEAVTTIVLHHTAMASTAEKTAEFFQNPKVKVSAHYVIDRDGSIIRCVPDAKRAWHAGRSQFQGKPNVNDFSVGIEICNLGDGVEPYPAEQVAAVVRLVAWLAQEHRVTLAGGLTRHRDVALPAGRKKDTSDNFDHGYVLAAAQKLLNGETPPHYRPSRSPAGYDPTRQTYRVQPGDTLPDIAEHIYDVPALAPAIARMNAGRPLQAGTLLRLPTTYPATL